MTERACYLETSKSYNGFEAREYLRQKISVVIPIHNEQKYLPYSLRSLENCPIDELIFFLDRCTDNSLHLINEFSTYRYNCKIIESDKSTWKNQIAYTMESSFKHATGDLIFLMGADIITHSNIYNSDFFTLHDLVSFRYSHATLGKRFQFHEAYLNILNKLPFVYTCKFGKWSGQFGVKRKVWENLHFNDVSSPDLDFFNRAYEHGFKHRFVKSSQITHLRCGNTRQKQIGQAQHRINVKASPLKVTVHSFASLKPHLLAEYLKEKLG